MGLLIAWAWKAAGAPTSPDPASWGVYPLPLVWRKFFAAAVPLLFLSFTLWRVFTTRALSPDDPLVRSYRLRDAASYGGFLPLLFGILFWRRLGDWYFWLGGFFVALVMAKTAIAASFEAGRPWSFGPSVPKSGLFWVPALGFAFLGAWLSFSFPATGDEPHYLLLAHSIVYDGDLDLKNNLAQEDYLRFCWVGFPFHYFATAPGGGTYSMGYNGLFPFILAPGYALFGRMGAVLSVCLISAWMVREAALLTLDVTRSIRAAKIAWLLIGLTPPVVYFSGQVYPETLAGLLLILFLRRFAREDPRLAWWGAGVMLVLVATKVRFGALSGGVLLLLLVRLRTWRARILASAGFLLFAAGLFWADRALMDGFLIHRQSVDAGMSVQKMLPSDLSVTAALGFIFDQEFGLLPYAPLYAVGLLGLAWFGRRHPSALAAFGAAIGAYLYVLLTYQAVLWHAGWSTPARYVTGLAPLLGVVAAAMMAAWSRGTAAALGTAGAAVVIPQVWFLTVRPIDRYNLDVGSAILLQTIGEWTGSQIARYFPSVVNPTQEGNVVLVLVILGIIGGAAVIGFRNAGIREDGGGSFVSWKKGAWLGAGGTLLLAALVMIVGRTQPTRVLQGEAMQADGGSHFSDGQKNVWVLENNATLRGEILARGGPTELMIFAGGLSTDEAKPVLGIDVDDRRIAEVEIHAGETDWVEGVYKISTRMEEGRRGIRIGLLNGTTGQGVFRGSFVDRVEICGHKCSN